MESLKYQRSTKSQNSVIQERQERKCRDYKYYSCDRLAVLSIIYPWYYLVIHGGLHFAKVLDMCWIWLLRYLKCMK
jgi:hypothetical protein